MKPIEHFEVPHLALWKSCVAEVLAKQHKQTKTTAYGIDMHHEMMQATDKYCRTIEAGKQPKKPAQNAGKISKMAYASYLHHKKAHAKIADDKNAEAVLEKQIAEFKFGNPLWQQMFIQYYKYYWQYPYHKGAKPQYRSWKSKTAGKGNINYGVIDWKLPANARIAIVGDIGTGTDVAAAVIEAACKFKPDAILHLGDIYFSGTKAETQKRLVGMVKKALKKEKLNIPFFTVPGNHEYFTGCVSFFEMLDAGSLIYKKSQLQKASYFCLRTEDNGWQFLGMDTGYNGHYMNVAKGAQAATLKYLHIGEVQNPQPHDDPHWPTDHNPYFLNPAEATLPQKDTTSPVPMVTIRPDEQEWHADKLNNFKGKTILLSHHQLYSALDVCGLAQKTVNNVPEATDVNRIWVNTGLWQQFGKFFGDKVAVWLWGHEHNLVIFEDNYRPTDWPTDAAFMQTYKNLPKGRCAGHSAIPVQDTEQPYKVNYHVPLKDESLKLGLTTVDKAKWYNHGFQLLELTGAGNPARLSYFQIELTNAIPLPLYVETIQ